LSKPFKSAQKLLEGEKYGTLFLLPIAIKSIRMALIKIVGAEGGGAAQNRVNNLVKRLLFDFRERWKPDEASQYLEGDIVTRGRGNRQVGLHPLAAFAFNATLPACSWWYSTNCPEGADQPDKPGSQGARIFLICTIF
jgi:hypothetical protein